MIFHGLRDGDKLIVINENQFDKQQKADVVG